MVISSLVSIAMMAEYVVEVPMAVLQAVVYTRPSERLLQGPTACMAALFDLGTLGSHRILANTSLLVCNLVDPRLQTP